MNVPDTLKEVMDVPDKLKEVMEVPDTLKEVNLLSRANAIVHNASSAAASAVF
jgi:hypothetical protein